MSEPTPDPGTSMAVICHTCGFTVWRGNALVEQDGQTLLTAYADSVAGTVCPSKVDPCPNKSPAIAARPVPVTAADLAGVKKRLDAIEAKVKP
jgi:hypothetical protein